MTPVLRYLIAARCFFHLCHLKASKSIDPNAGHVRRLWATWQADQREHRETTSCPGGSDHSLGREVASHQCHLTPNRKMGGPPKIGVPPTYRARNKGLIRALLGNHW